MMRTRPFTLTIVGAVFVATGCVSLVRGSLPMVRAGASGGAAALRMELRDGGIACASGLLAVVGGAYVLLGRAWARWICLTWLALHVIVSAMHDVVEMAMHVLLLIAVAWLIYRAPASAYFLRAATRSRRLE